MKEMNLQRLLDSCCSPISDDLQEALFDYLMEIEVDLNTLNVDDLYINSVQYFDNDEDVNFEDYYLLLLDDEGGYYL